MTSRDSKGRPRISIVIPVYNEEAILEVSVKDLVDRLRTLEASYEVILAENGSRDRTVQMAEALCARFPQVRTFSVGEPNYGKALRRGILDARGELVICDEIDLCDTDFYASALDLLDANEADLVVGSKRLDLSRDERPLGRRWATMVMNDVLRILLGFKGTDTHGQKAFKRKELLDIVERCVVDKDMFASELVIRAERSRRVRIKEIPVRVLEKRQPSIHVCRRVPGVLKGLARLVYAIRIQS